MIHVLRHHPMPPGVVWKFPLLVTPEVQEVEMPLGANILSLGVQVRQVCMWALVDPRDPKVKRSFLCVPTGHGAYTPNGAIYLDTLYLPPFVWHFFEVAS